MAGFYCRRIPLLYPPLQLPLSCDVIIISLELQSCIFGAATWTARRKINFSIKCRGCCLLLRCMLLLLPLSFTSISDNENERQLLYVLFESDPTGQRCAGSCTWLRSKLSARLASSCLLRLPRTPSLCTRALLHQQAPKAPLPSAPRTAPCENGRAPPPLEGKGKPATRAGNGGRPLGEPAAAKKWALAAGKGGGGWRWRGSEGGESRSVEGFGEGFG